MATDLDIGDLCDCVAGGMCRPDTRTARTMHRIRLYWADPADTRDPDTVASPAQLDEWMTSAVIDGAWCPTCQDDVSCCPSFNEFLTASGWDTSKDDT
jgi:hypothetical protein